jgi:hypothetical protein
MSKCKAVLDSDKITEIRVKTKAQENPTKDKPEPQSSDESQPADSTATQQSE